MPAAGSSIRCRKRFEEFRVTAFFGEERAHP